MRSSSLSVAEALPAIAEFADLAGALIGREVVQRTEVDRGRGQHLGIIARRAFYPVFQPIVDLGSRTVVGYEALTRFSDFDRAGLMFAEAAAVGLGVELETATIRASLAAADSLPPVCLAQPERVAGADPGAGTACRAVPQQQATPRARGDGTCGDPDYAAFREAVQTLGPKVRLAVDDAGAGFASLRHILELRPAFVKLDRWLVSRIEGDEARQAMIVGLIHFARATGCRLIAEGIETENELAMLRSLGIGLGQGYLLGRPCPPDNPDCQPGPAAADSSPEPGTAGQP